MGKVLSSLMALVLNLIFLKYLRQAKLWLIYSLKKMRMNYMETVNCHIMLVNIVEFMNPVQWSCVMCVKSGFAMEGVIHRVHILLII
uniref:Putative secreted protein n=1 Tax=Xenopsylla cheopis TaxID=163159 RepID=A0A6M2DYC9_XENCH